MDIPFSLMMTAFSGGLFMALAPCTFPILVVLIASLAPIHTDTSRNKQRKWLISYMHTIAFVLGFTLVFSLLGVLAGMLGTIVIQYKDLLTQIGGVMILIVGIVHMGVIRIPHVFTSKRLFQGLKNGSHSYTRSFLIGSTFGIAWAPCSGPILTAILLMTATTATVFQGGTLLFIFSLGLAVPLILAGLLYSHIHALLLVYGQYVRLISILGGFFLVCVGLLLILNNYMFMTTIGMHLMNFLGFTPMCVYR